MDRRYKEIIEKIKALHPEISDKSWDEVDEFILGNSNHVTTQFTLSADEVTLLQSLFKAIKIADKNELIHLGLVFDTFIDCLLNRIKQWQDGND